MKRTRSAMLLVLPPLLLVTGCATMGKPCYDIGDTVTHKERRIEYNREGENATMRRGGGGQVRRQEIFELTVKKADGTVRVCKVNAAAFDTAEVGKPKA